MQQLTFSEFLKLINPNNFLILDIDSSLVLTHKRNEAVLHRFADEFSADYPDFCARLKTAECLAFEYGYQRALERADLHELSEPCAALATFWRRNFFSNDFLHHDLVHDGAVEFVEILGRREVPFAYLTGRPHPTMFEGTLRCLKNFGFGVTPDQLFLKPVPEDRDELFKTRQFGEFKKKHEKILFIDNEPKVLNQIHADHPEIPLVFVDTCHSPNVIPPSKCLKIKDFREIVQKLK